MNDIISIVTINYNNLNGLINTVNSVFNQSNNNFQYVIIDGNSTDGSKEFLQSLFHDNIKIISESDSGIYNAFNKGIQNSSGQYILFLNSGDVLYDSNSIALIYNTIRYDYDVNIYSLLIEGQKMHIKTCPNVIDLEYLTLDFIPHPSSLISKKLFDHLGVYDEKFLFTGDHEFFLRVLLKSKFNCFFVHSDVIAIHYRDGISNSQENFNKIILERDKSLQANLHDDFLFQATKFYLEFRSIKGFLYLLKSIWIRINFK